MKRVLSILAICLLLAGQAHAAISIGTAVFSNQTTTAHTFAVDVGASADRYLLVFVAEFDGTISSVTYNGDAMAQLATHANHPIYVTVFGLANPDSGSHDVVVTLTGSAGSAMAAIPFSGVHQTVSTGTIAEAAGNTNAITVDASSATGEVVADAVFGSWISDAGTLVVGAGQTEHIDQGGGIVVNGSARMFGMSTEAGAATTTMSWTADDTSLWTQIAVPLKPAAGGGGGATPVRHRVIQ